MGALIGRVGIIGAILLGGWFLVNHLTGAAGELQVGDCFDAPRYVGEADEVPHHACTDPHEAEVVYVGDYAPAEGEWPEELAFDAFAEANCVPAFSAYTGLDFTTAAEYEMGFLFPTEEDWAGGDRKIRCYAVRADLAPMTNSIRVAQ